MTRRQVGSVISAVAAIGFLGTAALHSTGYSLVVRASAQAPELLRGLLSTRPVAAQKKLTASQDGMRYLVFNRIRDASWAMNQ